MNMQNKIWYAVGAVIILGVGAYAITRSAKKQLTQTQTKT